jgi:predicted PhzF superfamily epimerase YddE/YHI9
MTVLHVLRVFMGPDGSGGNPLGVFVDASMIEPGRRQAVAADLAFSETVFVGGIVDGVATVAIHTPATELPFAGHPTVGTSWLLRNLGEDVTVVRCRSGDVAAWHDGELAWIRSRADWVAGIPEPDRLASPGEVDQFPAPAMGEPGHYIWAWEDEPTGRVRARFFPTDLGIAEDEATGAAAVLLGERLDRPLTIRQGVGSELHVRTPGAGWIEVGGRVELVEERPYGAEGRT